MPNRPVPNIRDVAACAHVSPATASRALRGSTAVAVATRDRVLQAADELGYRLPRPVRHRPLVAILARSPQQWFYAEAIGAVEEALTAAGHRVLLHGVRDEASRHRLFGDPAWLDQLDGVVVVSTSLSAAEQQVLDGLRIGVVAIGGELPGYARVGIDEELAARIATQHLIGLGHREIGMISFDAPDPVGQRTATARRRGFEQALRTSGIPVVPEWVIAAAGSRMSGGSRAAEQLLTLPRLPTAVFAMSDELAIGALRAIRRAGLRVPGHLSVVGFDDHEMAEFVDLTTVRQSVRDQARAAAALLDGDAIGARTVQVPVRLVVRGTTGPPA